MEYIIIGMASYFIGVFMGRHSVKKVYGDALERMFYNCSHALTKHVTNAYGGNYSTNQIIIGKLLVQAANDLNSSIDQNGLK